ncbi:hypothetical protein SCP_1005530 [Sparassis crispa]|uniref:Uncharacterized protein n=1 Tax=Sparassis crispa TaxID=139825 RepID=A0A401GYR7_9APHY|nr:hypothetical protein SCP_1005530 [Sparassis crispa]GBE87305.1 hypothetical protein SCP_1005530 [Sparassis crispa]
MVKNDIQVKEELVEQILGTLDEGNVKHDWLEGLLYARYGFINNPRYEEVTKKVLEPKHVMGALAEKQYRFEVEEMGHGIIHFVSSLANAQVPEEQWDLCEKNPAYVLEIHKPMFRVQRYKFADNSWGYALTPVKTRLIRSWQIVVRDAMAVIQCVRCEWGPSLEELAAEYVRIGIPFQTLMSVAMDRVQWRDTGLCPSVPRRSKDFKATQEEYDIYVHRRDQLLSQPRARAAALAGGILWRLSREALEHRRDVPLGPSKEVTSYYGPTAGEQSGTLDDTLTEDEIKILHGMYYVETGESAVTLCQTSYYLISIQVMVAGTK